MAAISAARVRLAIEARQGRALVADAADEAAVQAACKKRFTEALQSVLTLPAGNPTDELSGRVAAAIGRLGRQQKALRRG
jgi:hypothetical protein